MKKDIATIEADLKKTELKLEEQKSVLAAQLNEFDTISGWLSDVWTGVPATTGAKIDNLKKVAEFHQVKLDKAKKQLLEAQLAQLKAADENYKIQFEF